MFYYRDASGNEQGPFSNVMMRSWYEAGYFTDLVTVGPSYHGEVPEEFWPIAELWDSPAAIFIVSETIALEAAPAHKPEFLASEAFAGTKPGYVFKAEPDGFGTGYFLDTPPVPEVTAESLESEKRERANLWQRQGMMRFGCLNDLAN